MKKYLAKIGEAVWQKIQIINRAVLGAAVLANGLLIAALVLVIFL